MEKYKRGEVLLAEWKDLTGYILKVEKQNAEGIFALAFIALRDNCTSSEIIKGGHFPFTDCKFTRLGRWPR